MAQAPALHDFDLELNQIDRGIEKKLHLRTARHSSETLERVWLRVLGFCMQWEERLAFGPGLSDPDAPDLLSTDLTGQTTLWMRVGKADPARLQRASDQNPRARIVALFEIDAAAGAVHAGGARGEADAAGPGRAVGGAGRGAGAAGGDR